MPASSLPASGPGIRTSTRYGFASASRFLAADADNPDLRALRASLARLSGHIEQAIRTRRACPAPEAVEQQAALLERHLGEHQRMLAGLDSAWHALHEFRAYQQALRMLHGTLQDWRAALRAPGGDEPGRFGAFERLAWRTLGEALLVLDLYEQHGGGAWPASWHSSPPPPRRAPLLARLRRWLGRGRV